MDFPGFQTTIHWSEYRENFESPSFQTDQNQTNQNIANIQSIQSNIKDTQQKLIQNYPILSTDIATNESKRQDLQKNNPKYHYTDRQDPNIILRPEESKDIQVAIQQDIQQMKLYQNSIYVTGAIAGATLLIAAIIFVKQ